MPLNPYVVAEVAVGPTCPDETIQNVMATAVRDAVKSILTATGLDVSRHPLTALPICEFRESLESSIVTVGVWLARQGFTDQQLRSELQRSSLLLPGRSVALFVTTPLVKLIFDSKVGSLPAKRGRLFIRKMDLNLDAGKFVTTASGSIDTPLSPNPAFDFTMTETLSIGQDNSVCAGSAGLIGPFSICTTENLDAGTYGEILLGLILDIVSAIDFFGANIQISASLPPGPGASLAAVWPTQVLTPISHPLLPTGKLALNWMDATVNTQGISTLGTFTTAPRRARITVGGPSAVVIREELGEAQATYRAQLQDLRNPNISWIVEGAHPAARTQGDSVQTVVFLPPAGQAQIDASATDDDGLTARSPSLTVDVSVRKAPPGTQPF